MVKIAVSSQTPNGLEAITDMRFGRCPFYTIVEVDGNDIRNVEVVENPAVSAFGGAGIQAAQFIANQGVKVVIAGNYGPNAYNALS
ncbi:MAG: NifB/NifX family molybdenum-iron cluster-binding protein, partial [Candidatus Freyarchaeota archaeon]